jgi:predicted AlkP superfamily phosphohydrolase/phosphomutase
MSRVVVVGLDALDAAFIDEWLDELPNLRRIAHGGIHGPVRSIVQPVTPVAWTSAISGRNPGHFGFTDFLYRPEGGYGPFKLVHSGAVTVPTLYDWLAESGLTGLMLGVPVAYPPLRVERGVCVSCFMTPTVESGIVHPPELEPELLDLVGDEYLIDVTADDGESDRFELRRRLLELDRQRFAAALHLARTRPWDLLFLVCMGTDRVGHYFVHDQDELHPSHDPSSPHREAILDHYRACDELLGSLLDELGDDVTVLVLGDHGMQRREGTVHLNQWLCDEGYLRLSAPVDRPTRLADAPVDWSRTRAWAKGYGGQIFLNLRGRDPEGIVEPDEAEALRSELANGLATLRRPDGTPLPVEAYDGPGLYDGPSAGSCPDLCVQFDELRFLTTERVGAERHVETISPDVADQGSHANDGFLALAGPNVPRLGRFDALHLLDVAATLRELLGLPPIELDGYALTRAADDAAKAEQEQPYGSDDERELTQRLEKLYLE